MIVTNNDDFYLLQDVLKRNYFVFFERGQKNIEFILNNNCNQNCENCFGCSYDKEAYKNQNIFLPQGTHKYNNLLDLTDWYIDHKFVCNIIFRGCVEEEAEESFLNTLNNMYKKFKQNNKTQINNEKQSKIIFLLQKL